MEKKPSSEQRINTQNMLLAGVALLLAIQIIISSMNLYVNFRMKKQGEATRLAAEAQSAQITADIHQTLENSRVATQDLIADYQRDRDAILQEEDDYLIKQLVVGNDYMIYALMLQAEQNDKLLDLLSKLP